jgi:hypothetical protein
MLADLFLDNGGLVDTANQVRWMIVLLKVHGITHLDSPSPSDDDDRLTGAGGDVSLPCGELGLRASSMIGWFAIVVVGLE